MANARHLEILKNGASEWNEWRISRKYDVPDLRGIDLSGLDLRDVNFVETDLSGSSLQDCNLSSAFVAHAFLEGVNLDRALLSETNFRDSYMPQASFESAELNGAKFGDAYLKGVNFRNARLFRAKFINADLRQADFRGARFGNTIIGRSNLSGAKGLSSCFHEEPSIIDVATFAKSGNLPLKFLRGCGVPDLFINYLPSLTTNPIEFYSCFISYSSKDEKFATQIYNDLQDAGVRCWFAPHDLKVGDKIRSRIDESIGLYDKLLLILSKHSISSDWVEQEAETALARERREKKTLLFPIRLDNAVMKQRDGWSGLIHNSRHIGDFRRWKEPEAYQESLQKLVQNLSTA